MAGKSMSLSLPPGLALVPIIAFHSTPVMNFVAYFGIVSLYGKLTSRGVGWINRYPKSADGRIYGTNKNDNAWFGEVQKAGIFALDRVRYPGGYSRRPSMQIGRGLYADGTKPLDDGVVMTKFESYKSEDPITLLKTLEPSLVWRLRNRNCKADSSSLLKTGVVITVDEYFVL
ncbi:hypothetical protein BKA70DRAFT_1447096 [Coprinopsis sp. MPI-PUGE-AT-0042]|nr:hypothetical protein BKA70DRAFT_1447096 [Coprinopsis sp. MPI-PUGE-AT-0042]